MGFFSKEFKEAISNSKYWKVKDMPQGENRFRIVQAPIYGWIDWKDQKPYRYRADKKPRQSFDEANPIRAFVTCYVWDYSRKGLYALEFTQKSVIMALEGLSDSEDWGDLTGYDLKLLKEGSGQKVKYTLNPVPHKPMSEEIKSALRASPANLDALFAGGDPWNWGPQIATQSTNSDSVDWILGDEREIALNENKGHSAPSALMSPIDELREHLEIDGIPTDRLEEWIKLRAQTKNESAESVIKACLVKDLLPKFKKSFSRYIAPVDADALAV